MAAYFDRWRKLYNSFSWAWQQLVKVLKGSQVMAKNDICQQKNMQLQFKISNKLGISLVKAMTITSWFFLQSLLLGKAVAAEKFDINFRVQEGDGGLSSSFAPPCLALQTPISLCAISAIMEHLQFRPQLVIILEKFWPIWKNPEAKTKYCPVKDSLLSQRCPKIESAFSLNFLVIIALHLHKLKSLFSTQNTEYIKQTFRIFFFHDWNTGLTHENQSSSVTCHCGITIM